MKFLASLIATTALTLSALVAVPTTASAAPYPGTVTTHCDYVVPGSVKKNRKLYVTYRVRANGNAHPSGVVKLRVYRILNNGRYDFDRGFSQSYTGPNWRTTSLGTFKKTGRYATKMWFVPKKNSVYKVSNTGYRFFKVKKR